MLRLVLLVVAVVCASASGPSGVTHCCSAGDRHIVQEQWAALWEDTESAKMKIGFGRLIYEELFKAAPEVKDLLKGVHSENTHSGAFTAHSLRLTTGLDLLINLLDDPEALEAAIEHLADRYSKIEGVKKDHFIEFAKILDRGLPKILPKFNYLSWKSCVTGLVRKITHKL